MAAGLVLLVHRNAMPDGFNLCHRAAPGQTPAGRTQLGRSECKQLQQCRHEWLHGGPR